MLSVFMKEGELAAEAKNELVRNHHVELQVLQSEFIEKYKRKIDERESTLSLHPDSGFDLFVPKDVVIPPGEVKVINMQVKCAVYGRYKGAMVPLPYYLYPRSSVSKRGIILANSVGVIDCGYRGSLMAGFFNTKREEVTIKAGERIVQICMSDLCPYYNVSLTDNIESTDRNEGGLGSTGL